MSTDTEQAVAASELAAGFLLVFLLGPFFVRASLGDRFGGIHWPTLILSLAGSVCWALAGLVVLEMLGYGVGVR